jgi:hypothetical protein
VLRYVHPDTFAMFEREAYAMGFRHAASARWCARRIMPIDRPKKCWSRTR